MYFHPRLCRNSVEMHVCLTKTCKDVHLVGTQRFKPRANYHHEESQQNQRYSHQQRNHRYQENSISTWQKPQNLNSQHSANEAEKSKHFLIQYLENMRADLTKSIEMKIESALQYRAEKKEVPYLTTPPETAKPDPPSQDPNPYQHQAQPDPTQTLTSMGLIPTTQHQFQHQPLNFSQPSQMQNQIPFLHMY